MSRSTSPTPIEIRRSSLDDARDCPEPGRGAERAKEILSLFSRRRFLHASAAALGGALLPVPCLAEALGEGGSASAQQVSARISTADLGGVTLLQGAGCNVITMAGADGALMIDGGRAADAEALLAAVRSATGSSSVHTLINTH